jgi:hypothetical protein
MTQAFNLSQFANKLNSSGQTDNTGLQNSSVTVTAGTGMSGGGAVALGSSVTLTNAGVTSIVAGSGISISGATGAVTITNSFPSAYVGTNGQVFTANGTFTVPTGVTIVKVICAGGGGGGAGVITTGGTGGTSTFSTISASGGAGGGVGGAGGSGGGTSGSPNWGLTGNTGGNGNGCTLTGGAGGVAIVPFGNYSYGGRGVNSDVAGGGGGSGGYALKYLSGLTPGGTISVTVGGAGSAGTSAVAGSAGYVWLEW